MTIKDLIQEGKAKLEKCSEGPWKHEDSIFESEWYYSKTCSGVENDKGGVAKYSEGAACADWFSEIDCDDADFITFSRNNLATLLQALEQAEEVIRFYGDEMNYKDGPKFSDTFETYIGADLGALAREVLKGWGDK